MKKTLLPNRVGKRSGTNDNGHDIGNVLKAQKDTQIYCRMLECLGMLLSANFVRLDSVLYTHSDKLANSQVVTNWLYFLAQLCTRNICVYAKVLCLLYGVMSQ